MEQGRSAALLVRIWLERGTGEFRARLTAVDTSGQGGAGEDITLVVAASPGDVMKALRTWLEEFAGHGAIPD